LTQHFDRPTGHSRLFSSAIPRRGFLGLLPAMTFARSTLEAPPADGSGTSEQMVQLTVRWARDFAVFLGVNTHFSQRTPHYRDGQKAAADLRYLGISAIRDGCNAAPATVAVYRELVRSGIRICAVYDGGTVEQTIAAARTLAELGPKALLALEGPNEANNWPVTFQGATTRFAPLLLGGTFLPAARLQRALYAAARHDKVLAKVPVWQLTSGGAEPDNCGLQYLTIPKGAGTIMPEGTVFADVANLHVYSPKGLQAQGAKPSDDRFRNELVSQFGVTWGGRHFFQRPYQGYLPAALNIPTVITESGYHSNAPGSVDGVDPLTQAKNLINAMLGAWEDGYRGFFIYELYDEAEDGSDEGSYGIFDAKGQPKPAARAIHALTAFLAEQDAHAADFAGGEVEVTIVGAPATARWTALQGDGGHPRIIMWNSAANWDATSRRPISVLPQPVTLRFGRPWARITVFDLILGTYARDAENEREITVPLTDHPIVVTLIPSKDNRD
jgi:hypothetical protein